MVTSSPYQNKFEGEWSPLALGRFDIDRYARAMRFMQNAVASRTGPFLGRSGTMLESWAAFQDIDGQTPYYSKLIPFVFNEVETLVLEFAHQKLFFHYEFQQAATYREFDVTAIVTVSPLVLTVPGHDWEIGERVVFEGFDPARNLGNRFGVISAVAGNNVTLSTFTNVTGGAAALSGNEKGSIVYEVTTPYHRDDVRNIRAVQNLNTVYLFCKGYRPQILKRYDTFDWRLSPFPKSDGPYLDVDTSTNYLVPNGNGTWMPTMTSNTAPAPAACSASSAVPNHEAWRAFDGDIDSYWEGNASQEGWLEFNFDVGIVNDIPKFTSSTSGGMTISALSQSSGEEAWKAADRDNGTDWRSSGTLPQWWMLAWGVSKDVKTYRLRASKDKEEFAPRDWTVEVANASGGPWTIVDTRTGHEWESGEEKGFTVQSHTAGTFIRIVVTKVNRKNKVIVDQLASDEKYNGQGEIVKDHKVPKNKKKGGKHYTPRITHTVKTDNRAGFSSVEMDAVSSSNARVVDGYTIYLGRYAKGKEVKGHAPKTWYFEGWDGDNWDLLDSQQDYKDWDEYRSEFFPIKNPTKHKKYRIRIKECVDHGDTNPRIGKLLMSSPDAPSITLTANSKTSLNDGQGFLPTDVGRVIRLKDADLTWRWGWIATVVSTSTITLQLPSNDPLVLNKRVQFFRLGVWSDTTGWPIAGVIHEDRLWCVGASGFPDHVIGSRTGNHTNFRQISPQEVVADTHAIVIRANSRYMSQIQWVKSAQEALLLGTGKEEFILTTPVDEALSARNAKIRKTTERGSIDHEPVLADNHVLMLSGNGRTLYDYSWQPGGETQPGAYSSVTMSALGQHLLEPALEQIVYQQEPHTVVWARRTDGSVVAATYNNEFDVKGGHRHDFGAVVEDMCVCPSPTDKSDQLWMVVQRFVNGQWRRYIERLFRFWDFGDLLEDDATYVDSALRYYGTVETSVVYGLWHLEGQLVTYLADNIIYNDRGPVVNGALTLERPALHIVIGKPFVTEGEIVSPNIMSREGTNHGKSQRPHSVVMSFWQSARGEVGRFNEDTGLSEWTPILYHTALNPNVPEITLVTATSDTTVVPMGYDKEGTIRFRQVDPLPMNVIAVLPQTMVSDDR